MKTLILATIIVLLIIWRESLFSFHFVTKESCFRQHKQVSMYAGSVDTWREGDEINYTCIEWKDK